MSNSQGYGQQGPNDASNDMSSVAFIVRQMIARMSTMKIVQVKAVTGGGVATAGTVDVFPLVQQIDGNGYGTSHGVVHGIPWSRVQGGKNAIICDPQVGDIGYVVAADRDSSKVVTTKAEALPGSRRRYSISDGIYAGGCLNVAPNQYLIFTATGLRLVDKNGNSIAMSNTGTVVTDSNSNVVSMTATGMTLTDRNGNQIQMKPGIVNVVTGAFQVNGVPVTVP